MSHSISQTNRRRHENKRVDLCHFLNFCLSETFFFLPVGETRDFSSSEVWSDLKHLVAYTMENIDHMLHICHFFRQWNSETAWGRKEAVVNQLRQSRLVCGISASDAITLHKIRRSHSLLAWSLLSPVTESSHSTELLGVVSHPLAWLLFFST